MVGAYWLETLGCPKNQVDSDKLAGLLEGDGLTAAGDPGEADIVVVNTCAFIDAARAESVETVLDLSERRREGARLVVTGCMAERYGDELSEALPEVDLVAGFGKSLTHTAAPPAANPVAGGAPVALLPTRRGAGASVAAGSSVGSGAGAVLPDFDLLNLPRPKATAPWAYVKVAEGCDRKCGFCAIPSFRGKQRSRTKDEILREVDALEAQEVVLVAQDLASYGRDLGKKDIVGLVEAVSRRVSRTRLLYLYPSELSESLIEAMGATGCHYFDLSLQHASRAHLRRMRRWGDGDRFRERIERIRRAYPDSAMRSSFIVGYPGETEEDHDELLSFLRDAQLDWAGFFPYSAEEGTYAAGLPDAVPAELAAERLAECSEMQDTITARRRAELIGSRVSVLVDAPGVGRSHREAPEIDGVVSFSGPSGRERDNSPSGEAEVGSFVEVEIRGAEGPDLIGTVA